MSKCMFFQLLLTIKVNLVDKMKRITPLFYFYYSTNIIGDELLLNFGAKFQR